MIMSVETFSKRYLRRAGILALAPFLFGCIGLPDWSDDPVAGELGVLQGDWEFPDLSQLPTPTGPPPSATEQSVAVRALESARLQNQRAGENLSSQIENDFRYPTASGN